MALLHALILGFTAGLAAAGGCPYAGHQPAARAVPYQPPSHAVAPHKAGIFYMNRIGPSGSQLYIANADGSNKRLLMRNNAAAFDYHASWSSDNKWIVFTSERRADGQADIYRVKTDGTGLETLVNTNSFEDAGTLSPDGTKLAFVSTQGNHTANIWVKNLKTGISKNLTDTASTRGDPASPQGYFRPSWSPDGEWIAFTSDRNTDWTGHSNGTGWEHTQTLSIYIIRPDGSGFRKIIGQDGYSLMTPKWSPNGKRLIYNVLTTEDTYDAHGIQGAPSGVTSKLMSVDVATGLDVVVENSDPNLKMGPSWIGNGSTIGYVVKQGANEGVAYTVPDAKHKAFNQTYLRNPSWSPDGTKLVYEVYAWDQRPAGKSLFSFDDKWDYRFMDVFPQFNNATSRLAITSKQLGNSSVLTATPEYKNVTTVFDVFDVWSTGNQTELTWLERGTGGAFQPTFKPDGSQIAVGLGTWFFARNQGPGILYLANTTGDGVTQLTDGGLNAGFPSFSPDGTKLVYRLWDQSTSSPLGLRILDLSTGKTTNLTWGWDNTPGWSPDGQRIVFTRQSNWTESYGSRWYADRFDVYTIRPDGSELTKLTTSNANDAHAVWSYDGRILWNSGMFGFRDEGPQYDNTFQPYGQIMVMNADGSDKTLLTDSMWEDSMPLFIPAAELK